MNIPFCRPTIEEDEIREVVDSLESGWITTGPKVVKFEQAFKEWAGGKMEAISVNSATAGLHICLMCLDLKPGDQVITTSITCRPDSLNLYVPQPSDTLQAPF